VNSYSRAALLYKETLIFAAFDGIYELPFASPHHENRSPRCQPVSS